MLSVITPAAGCRRYRGAARRLGYSACHVGTDARRLSSVGQSNAFVMRRSGVRFPEAAPCSSRGQRVMRTVLPTRIQWNSHAMVVRGKCTQPCEPFVRYSDEP